MARQGQPDQWAWRVDAQLAELVETVWTAEKMWRLQDRIEGSIRYRLRRGRVATTGDGENDH